MMSMEQRHLSQDETPAMPQAEAASWRGEEQPSLAAAETETVETSTVPVVLTTLLQQEAHSRLKETWGALAWSGVFLASMLGVLRYAGTSAASLTFCLLLCFVFLTGIGWGLCSQFSRRASRCKRALTAALSRVNAKKEVGALVRTLQVQNMPVRNLAKQSLITLLPTLHAGDASLLGPEERRILRRQLAIVPNDPGYREVKELFSRAAYRRDMDLRLAILKALEQVGGEQELAAVERLARGLPTLHSVYKAPQELRAAAQACLPSLQTRAEDQRAGTQLLRASSLPTPSAADLLRPAACGDSTPSEQLLRPGESPVSGS